MNAPANGHTKMNIAEQRAAAYQAAQRAAGATPWPTVNPASVKLGAKVRAWLLAGLLGLLLGAGGMWAATNQFSPLAGAVAVRNGIVVSELDGARYFLVSGWAVPLPKAGGQ